MSESDFPPPSKAPLMGGYSFAELVQENIRWLLVLAVLVLMLIGIGIGVNHWRLSSHESSQAELAKIVGSWTEEVPDGATEISMRLKAFLADGPSGIAEDMARVVLGRVQLSLGVTTEAQATFERAIDAPEPVASVARMRLAYLKAQTGDVPAAETLFQQVMAKSPGIAPQAALELARLAEMAGNQPIAIQRYQAVVDTYPNALQAGESRARLRKLGVAPAPQMNLPDFSDAVPTAIPDAGAADAAPKADTK